MKPASFLNGFEKIIFDMDGVITSERNYWRCAALSVYELCYSEKYFGTRELDLESVFNNADYISNMLFCNDKTIVLLKNFGVNTNWDLAYLLFARIVGLNEHENYEIIYDYYKALNLKAPELYDHAQEILEKKLPKWDGSRYGNIWTMIQVSFNEWYYGEKLFKQAYGMEVSTEGKKGLMENELPMHSLDNTINLLDTLTKAGFILGIGTGRPRFELELPAIKWDILKYFDPKSCCTYDMTVLAQERLGGHIFLSKPNPFTFLKATFGVDYTDEIIVAGEYDKEYIKKVLIVGDAGADILAAQAMGAKFAAVLTGVNGVLAKDYFVDLGADFILNSVLNFIEE